MQQAAGAGTLRTHTSETWPLLFSFQTTLPLDPAKDASCLIGSPSLWQHFQYVWSSPQSSPVTHYTLEPLSSICSFPSYQTCIFITCLLFPLAKFFFRCQTPWCLAVLFHGVMPHLAVSKGLVFFLLCCFQGSQSLGLLGINCVSNISPFPWAERNWWTWEVQRQHPRSDLNRVQEKGEASALAILSMVLCDPWESLPISFLIRFSLCQGTYIHFSLKT